MNDIADTKERTGVLRGRRTDGGWDYAFCCASGHRGFINEAALQRLGTLPIAFCGECRARMKPCTHQDHEGGVVSVTLGLRSRQVCSTRDALMRFGVQIWDGMEGLS